MRRTFFQWLAYGLSVVAASVLGIPLIGYFLGVRKREALWVTLDDPVDKILEDETKMHVFANPLREPWDGMTALTGVFVRNLGVDKDGKLQFLVFAVNCSPGLPRSWFPQSQPVHVPLPRRSLLRQRQACLRAAAARSL